MDDLIAELEAASEGSQRLDERILRLTGTTFASQAPNASGIPIPHYTTSLDAALPWENIRHVVYDRISGNWSAGHFVDNGHVAWGIGKTEVLARRIAAFKARQ